MTSMKVHQIGRLAMRVEGDLWNAYYAMPGTMENAVFLGSLPMMFAHKPKHKAAFMALMREVVGDMIESALGERPEWNDPVPASEAERTKE